MAWSSRRTMTVAAAVVAVTAVEGVRTKALRSIWKALSNNRGGELSRGATPPATPAPAAADLAAHALDQLQHRPPEGVQLSISKEMEQEVSVLEQDSVPRVYGPAAQTFMKHICKITFNRATVAFFAAAPVRSTSLCYYDVLAHPRVKGYVALTLDDAPCRGSKDHSEMQNVLGTLKEYNATATFMTVGGFAEGHEDDLVELLKGGHELGNHGMRDRRYDKDSYEDFSRAVDMCNEKIMSLQRAAGVREEVKWFRAPHGRFTKTMEKVLTSKGLTNTMCDTYASCPIIQDGNFIGDFLADNAKDGSIILLHMPERNFRTWCSTGLRGMLEGLKSRGFQAVTLSELEALAKSDEKERGDVLLKDLPLAAALARRRRPQFC